MVAVDEDGDRGVLLVRADESTQPAFADHRHVLDDLVREAVTIALADAGLELEDIEAVVYSLSPDAMVGIGNAERLGVDAVGARNKRFLRINTGGATGISSVAAAYYHIAAGACDVCMTAGADKVGECSDSQTVLNKIWDPTYERSLPLGTITMLAMSAILCGAERSASSLRTTTSPSGMPAR